MENILLPIEHDIRPTESSIISISKITPKSICLSEIIFLALNHLSCESSNSTPPKSCATHFLVIIRNSSNPELRVYEIYCFSMLVQKPQDEEEE